jgi:hypothetical protein
MASATAILLDTQVFEAASFNFKTTRLVSAIEEHDPAGTHGHHGLESPRLEHS